MPKVSAKEYALRFEYYPLTDKDYKTVRTGYYAWSFKSAKHEKQKYRIRYISQICKIKMQNA